MGYNIKQKIEICLKAESNPEMTQGELALWAMNKYGLDAPPAQTTISRILSSKNELIASKSADFLLIRRRKQLNPLLRSILTEWITQALWEGIPITTPIIQLTAHAIWTRLPALEKDGKGVFNQKWCNHFLKRLNVNLRGSHADVEANPGGHPLNRVWRLDEKLELKTYIRRLIEVENYAPQDIFTLDEFQLFYSLPLDQIFDVSLIDKGLKQLSSTTESSVTIMLGANIDGSEKLTPIIVGKYDKFDVSKSSHIALQNFHLHHHPFAGRESTFASQAPRAAGAAGGSDTDDEADKKPARKTSPPTQLLMNKITEVYNLYYKSNANKWITSSMFQNYLLTLEHKLANHSPERRIVILLDDSSSHRIINLKFSNIRLCYLKNDSNHKNPFNSTHNGVKFDYLPMSFGIIEEFRILYRLQQYLEMINIQRSKRQREKEAAMASVELKTVKPLTSSSIALYKPDLASVSTLTETDFDIPLIKVIEWIKRSWDSISPERIYLSWRRTHLINFSQAWPAANPNVILRAMNTLQPIHTKSAVYNTNKSFEKLEQVMGYLNVVIPWKIDELLGLVNESGKVTISYASIEEIIGSCLLEAYVTSSENTSEEPEAISGAMTAAANTVELLDWPEDNLYDRYALPPVTTSTPLVANSNGTMTIKSLLAATNIDGRPLGAFGDSKTLPPMILSSNKQLVPLPLALPLAQSMAPLSQTLAPTQPLAGLPQLDNTHWNYPDKRRRIGRYYLSPPPLLGNRMAANSIIPPSQQQPPQQQQIQATDLKDGGMNFSYRAPLETRTQTQQPMPQAMAQTSPAPVLAALSAISGGDDLIQNLSRIIQASDSGAANLNLSSTTLQELRNTLKQVQSRYNETT